MHPDPPQPIKNDRSTLAQRMRQWDHFFWQLARKHFLKMLSSLVMIGALLLAWTMWWEPNRLLVNQTDITLPRWPQKLGAFKIAALSDLHVGSPHINLAKVRAIVDATNAQKPDLIVLLGDYVIQEVVGGTFTAPAEFTAVLKDLKAPCGVFAVLGNHDWQLDGKLVTQAFEQVGIPVLTNDAQQLSFHGEPFWLVGMGDYFTQHHDFKQAFAKTSGTTAPIIVITHTPDVFLDLPVPVSITLAGHTHGGQVNLPLLGRRVVPSNYGDKYAIGYVEEGEKRLFVTTGIGTSILPLRFRVPPEIAILTIRPQA